MSASTKFVSVDSPNLVVESVKQAEDGDGTIVRLYECHNSRGSSGLMLAKPMKSAKRCNLEERSEADLPIIDGGIMFDYRPFEILTFRIHM